MNREDMLDIDQLNSQSEHMINSLSRNQIILNKSKHEVNKIKEAAGLAGKSYQAMRNRMKMCDGVVDALYVSNILQIKDCKQLESMIGTETLDGRDIFDKIEHFTNEKEYYIRLANYYNFLASYAVDQGNKEEYKAQRENALRVADSMEQLRKEYDNKRLKFDEIASRTSQLFLCESNIREYVKQGIIEIANPEIVAHYNSKKPRSWEKNIKNELKKWTANNKIEIGKDKYITITDENGNVWNGGSQFWFDNGTKNSFYVSANGCGLIALLDMQLYLEGNIKLTKNEYEQRMHQFLDSFDSLRSTYESGAGYKPVNKDENNDLQKILLQIVKNQGKYSEAHWNTERNINIEDIRDQLQHDIPVILVVSGIYQKANGFAMTNSPNLPFYEKNEDGDLVRVKSVKLTETEANVFKNAEKKGYIQRGSVKIDEDLNVYNPVVDGHAMTITGIEETIDPDTYEFKTVFTVKSWGREFYIYSDDVIEHQESRLQDYTSEIEKNNYLTTGNNNTSHVVY